MSNIIALNQKQSSSEIEDILIQYSKLVDPVIKEILAQGVDKKTKDLLHYQINTGGKRLRPTLAILSCLACGGKVEDVLYAAAGLEILHTYTLIIDDIIDHSDKRRNQPTTWKKFGRSFAECIAMDYSAAIFDAISESKHSQVITRIFSKTLKEIVDGEIKDILFEQSGRTDESYAVNNRYQEISKRDYLDMVTKKTASLMSAACEVGAICAGADERTKLALRNYGKNLGIAFQITDDILDIFGDRRFGKLIGKDIWERKIGNFVILKTISCFNKSEKNKFFKILQNKSLTEKDVQDALILIKNNYPKQLVINILELYIRKGRKEINFLRLNKESYLLENLLEYIKLRSV